ncbi:ATP-dependent translocase ABCB1 isoform X1 [Leptopilina heterotoma]|uniref:ATP-dependent translocase ABCB1 isoform X1 n=1 Tax=Leptopilina heterotoma TaxID=63436 RepID=UPI001CA80421|nr:ATP-dependent translocase ABCB1 isoform X1 [Leptopilina heterotoma]
MRLKSLIVKFLYIPKYLLIYLIGHPVNPVRDIFRYATKWETFLMLAGIISSVATGIAVPWNVQMFGKLAGGMVDAKLKSTFAEYGIDISEYIHTDVMEAVSTFAVGTIIISCILFSLSYVSICLFNYTSQRQSLRIRSMYLKSILHQDISWYDVMSCGDVASRLTEDVMKVEEGIGEKFIIFLHHFIAVIGSTILAFYNDWKLACICIVPFIVIVIILYCVAKATAKMTRKEVEVYAQAGSIAEESLSAIRTVVAFGGQKREFQRYTKNLLSTYKNNLKAVLLSALEFGLIWFSTYTTYSFAYWYGVELILRERLLPFGSQTFTPQSMAIIFFSEMMATVSLVSAAAYIETYGLCKASAAKVFSIIEQKSSINNLSSSGIRLPHVDGFIKFQNVSFEYPSRPNVKVLKNINLSIEKGETIALVGSSGCGKSTCIQLVQRFYDISGGQILIDGYDIRDFNVKWYRNQLGTVSQEPILFDTTVAENIRYGNMTASMEDIIMAAKEANAHHFIMNLPYQYHTLVGEGGTKISGGQKQRIAIARALVRDPKILLLDEATSALDTKMEAKVQAALDKVHKGRTTIIVAHRLSTIRGADKIIVLMNGEVVEQGNHDYLMGLKGHYHSLVTTQATSIDSIQVKEVNKFINKKEMNANENEDELCAISKIPFEAAIEEIQNEISTMKILKLSKPEWVYISFGCLASIFVGLSPPIFSTFFGDVIDELSGPDTDLIRKRTKIYCVRFILAGIFIGLSNFAQYYLLGLASECTTLRLRGLIFQAMLKQEIGWFDRPINGTGALCSKLSTEVAAVKGATGQRIGIIVQSYSTIVLSIAMSIYYEWRLGLLGTLFIPLILITKNLQNLMYKEETCSYHKNLERSTKIAVEAVSNIRTVIALGIQDNCYHSYVASMQPSLALAKRNTHYRGLIFAMARSISYIALACCMYYGGYLMKEEGIPYSTVFRISQALIMGTVMVACAFAYVPNVQKGLQAAANIVSILERPPEIQNPLEIKKTEKFYGQVAYKDVVFKYPSRNEVKVLDGLNLMIPAGKTVALIGPSGCGKSTMVQLLERFYDPLGGTVRIDNNSIDTLLLNTLRMQMGLVSQEPTLFARTIAENIAYGDNTREAPMWEIIEAAKQANAHEFITTLPLGYETKLGDRGTQLSGGQKQRIAIARVLIRNPKILLLDEATSALDSESEKVVQAALDKTRQGRSCILIAHRLSTVENADEICVINEGQIIESGTHKELLEKKGAYYELLCLQNIRR